MTGFIINSLETNGQTLLLGEVGVITRTGSLVTSGVGVTKDSYGVPLTVAGEILSTGIGVLQNYEGTIAVTDTGVISSYSTAISVENINPSNFFTLTNAGQISGNGNGVSATMSSITIHNYGTITANGFAVTLNGQYATINNTGLIHGASVGISGGQFLQNLTVVNSGVISGISAIESSFSTTVNIVNTGSLVGYVYMSAGNDTLNGAGGTQGVVFAQEGDDAVYGGVSDEYFYGDGGNDTLRGAGGEDSLDGGTGNDFLSAGAGADSLLSGTGADTLYGGADADTLSGDSENDRIFGGAGDDLIYGGFDRDVIYGGADQDFIYGGDANDAIYGGWDDDYLHGGAGNDRLFGGLGDDTLVGDLGIDTFVFSRNQGIDQITAFTNGTDKLDLRAFDIASLTALKAMASDSALGLRIDLPGEGMIFLGGFTYAQLSSGDVIL